MRAIHRAVVVSLLFYEILLVPLTSSLLKLMATALHLEYLCLSLLLNWCEAIYTAAYTTCSQQNGWKAAGGIVLA